MIDKIKVVISFLLIQSIFISGCTKTKGGEVKSSPVPVTGSELEFWTTQLFPNYEEQLKSIVNTFQSKNENIKVKIVDIPWNEMQKKITTASKSDGMPDIANVDSNTAYALAKDQKLVEMSSAAADVRNNYFENAFSNVSIDGKIYSIPWLMTVDIVFYNKDILNKSGIKMEGYPKSISELYTFGKKIKEQTGKYAFMPLLSQESMIAEFEKLDVPLYDDTYKANFTSKQVLDVVAYLKKMMEEGIIPKESLSEGMGRAIQMYCEGNTAFIQGSIGNTENIKKGSLEVYNLTGVSKQLFGKGEKVNSNISNIIVSDRSKYKDSAVKLAKYVTNNNHQIEISKVSNSVVPSTKESLNDDFYLKAGDTLPELARKLSMEEAQRSKELVKPYNNFKEISIAFNNALVKIISGSGKAEEILREAQESTNKAIQGHR